MTDLDGIGLEGVDVRLYSRPSWSSARDQFSWEPTGFEAHTDSNGEFAVVQPLLEMHALSLRLEPPEFYRGVEHQWLEGESQLHAGDNDLGVFTLAWAGVFAGRVLDTTGQPIEAARVRLSSSEHGEFVGSTDAEGHYRIANLPARHFGPEIRAEGYLSGRVSLLEVKERVVTDAGDSVLEHAPRLTGRVVDADGAPLGGASLRSWTASHAFNPEASTAEDGSFSIPLQRDESYTLRVTLEGYRAESTGVFHEPGTEGLVIALAEFATTRFAVVDAVTGMAVERFGLGTFPIGRGEAMTYPAEYFRPVPVADHPRGVVELPGDPALHAFTIHAPGYAPRRADVVHDEGAEGVQTIRLDRAGSLSGRLVRSSGPVAYPSVRVKPDRIPLRPDVTSTVEETFVGCDGEGASFVVGSPDWGEDVDYFPHHAFVYQGDEAGRFRIEDLAAGTYELRFDAAGTAATVLERVRVEAGAVTDVGLVRAQEPAALSGRIALASGVSVAGLVVCLGDAVHPDRKRTRTTNAAGEFGFDGLTAGEHYLWVDREPGVLVGGPGIECTLAEGEHRELVLDLSDRMPCEVRARVTIDGRPAEGLHLRVDARRWNTGRLVGITDSGGEASGLAWSRDEAEFSAYNDVGLLVGVDALPRILYPGGSVSFEFEFEAGRLELLIPHGRTELGAKRTLRAAKTEVPWPRAGWAGGVRWQNLSVAERHWTETRAGSSIDLGWIAPGTYLFTVKAGEQRLHARVEVEAGKAVRAELVE